MKTQHKICINFYQFLLLFLMLFSLKSVVAQSTKPTRAEKTAEKKQAVKTMMNNQNFVFMAQMALPQGWNTIQLNFNYNLTVSKDSVDSYLPYFGRAYIAPINPYDPAETGIRFKTKNFSYNSTNKKSGWEITIVPHDVRETRQMILSVSDLGYASLNVISNNRQPITFNGYISENKPKDQNNQ